MILTKIASLVLVGVGFIVISTTSNLPDELARLLGFGIGIFFFIMAGITYFIFSRIFKKKGFKYI